MGGWVGWNALAKALLGKVLEWRPIDGENWARGGRRERRLRGWKPPWDGHSRGPGMGHSQETTFLPVTQQRLPFPKAPLARFCTPAPWGDFLQTALPSPPLCSPTRSQANSPCGGGGSGPSHLLATHPLRMDEPPTTPS